MIYESAIVAATTTDLLATGRLNAIPYNGVLVLDFLADLADVTNFYQLTIQLPGGSNPIDAQTVPASGSGLDGVLDERELLRFSFQATQGGHYTVSLTENGTATCMFRAVLRP
jgi:hypothetical protein